MPFMKQPYLTTTVEHARQKTKKRPSGTTIGFVSARRPTYLAAKNSIAWYGGCWAHGALNIVRNGQTPMPKQRILPFSEPIFFRQTAKTVLYRLCTPKNLKIFSVLHWILQEYRQPQYVDIVTTFPVAPTAPSYM